MNLEVSAAKLINQINEFDDLHINIRYAKYLVNRHLELCDVVEGINIYTFYRTKENNRAFFALSKDLKTVIYYSELHKSNTRRFISRYIKADYEAYTWKSKTLTIKDFSSKTNFLIAIRESPTVIGPTPRGDVKLYTAPPSSKSFPFSIHPSMTEEQKGRRA